MKNINSILILVIKQGNLSFVGKNDGSGRAPDTGS